jgi:hypothetical protein
MWPETSFVISNIVLRILKVVLFNVFPDLFHDRPAGHGALSDHGFESGVKLQGLEKGGIGFSDHRL